MLKDRYGFMWIGTETGLYRYDGYNTELVNTTSTPISLSSDLVLSLYEDKQGSLWNGTNNGLNQLSPERTFIKTYLIASGRLSDGRTAIYAIAELSNGALWCSSDHGCIYHSADKKSFFPIPGTSVSDDKSAPQLVSYITEDDNHNIWTADNLYGFRKLNLAGEVVKKFSPVGNEFDIACYANKSVCMYARQKKLYSYSAEKDEFIPVVNNELEDLLKNRILDIYQDAKGYLWIVNGNKIIRFDKRSKHNDDFTQEFVNSSSNLLQIACMYEDANEQLWFGSYFGVYKLNNRVSIFNKIDLPRDIGPNPYFSVRGMVESANGSLFIGSYSGFFEYHKSLNTFQEYRINRDNKWMNPLVRAIIPDTNNNLWLATEGNGLLYFNTRSHTFTSYTSKTVPAGDNQPVLSSHNYSLSKDADGQLWLGGYNNLYTLNPRERELGLFTWGVEKNSLPPLKVTVICQAHDQSMWIGTDDGLYQVNKQKEVTAHYKAGIHALTSNIINCIYEDHNGLLWLGTKGGGIDVLNPVKGEVQKIYTVQDGLADDKICEILPGAKSELWISTYNGLSCLNTISKSFRNFYTRDGLQTNEFNQGSALIGREGNLYFGSMDGIISFDPNKPLPSSEDPQVILTKLVLHNGKKNKIEESTLSVQMTKKINLNYKDQFFTVYFTLKNNFENAEATSRFAYKLEGITDEWQNIGTTNYIQFAGLPPGNYVLRIKGMGGDGLWGRGELTIPVLIEAAFYATTGAYIFYAIAAILGIIMIYRFQVSRIRLKNKLQLEYLQKEKLHELDEMKSRFFTNITHEFRTPLTLIVSPLEQLIKQQSPVRPEILRQQHDIIYRNAQRLLRLINQLLDTAKLEAGRMTSAVSRGDIVLFISYLLESFRLHADEKGIQLQFVPGHNEHSDYLFDPEKLEKIIYNLLSNALKFTPAEGNIVVELLWHTDEDRKSLLDIKVRDSGMGIPAIKLPFVFDRFFQVNDPRTRAIEGSGVGLFLVKELTELLGGQVDVQSHEGNGTTFMVTLPLEKADGLTPTVQPVILPVINESEFGIVIQPLPLTEGPLVLVVEDHDELRSFVASALSTKYRVLTSKNGKEGWLLAQQELPDMVIADVTMPEMDGLMLSGLIKNTPLTTHIAVILLTARTSSDNRLQGLTTGANDYLTKPFNLDELHLRIANLLNYQNKLRFYWQQQLKQPVVKEQLTPATEHAVKDPFLLQVNGILERELSNSDFTVDQLALEMNVSPRTLHRKLTSLTGMNTSELIRSCRLTKAASFLKQGLSVSEAAYNTGFESLSYFSKCFKTQFAVSPSEYAAS